MLRKYLIYLVPIKRLDGRWMVSDLYTASFFIARGNTLVDVETTSDSRRLAFVIQPRDDFSCDLDAWRSNAVIPVRDFIDALHIAKHAMRTVNDRS